MSNLLIDERPLTLLPSLVSLVGFEKATILQQIHFTCQQPRSGKILDDGHKYVWNTYEEWCRDHFPFWSPEACRKHFHKLEEMGYLISVKPNAKNKDHTKHYRINYAQLAGYIPEPSPASASVSEPSPASASMNRPPRPLLNKESETSTEVAAKAASTAKTPSDHKRGMEILQQIIGPYENGGAQAKSLKFMLDHGATLEQIERELRRQKGEADTKFERTGIRFPVSYLTISKTIFQQPGFASPSVFIASQNGKLIPTSPPRLSDLPTLADLPLRSMGGVQ